MSRQSNDEYRDGRLWNGYDYDRQAWVKAGKYLDCSHPASMDCRCYGRQHAGEDTPIKAANNDLPEYCYTKSILTGKTIIIQRGQSGYYDTDYADLNADDLNTQLGVTKAQAAAMLVGSMFGWDTPGADPDRYDEDGKPK